MKIRTIINLLAMFVFTLLVIFGFFGMFFGSRLVSLLCGIGTLLVVTVAYKISNDVLVYLD